MKRCPFCAEEIQDAAIVCRFCGRDLPAPPPPPPPKPLSPSPTNRGAVIFLACCFGVIVVAVLVFNAMQPVPQVPARLSATAPARKGDVYGAFAICKRFVTDRLKAPATADFASFSDGEVERLLGDRFKVTSYVDSQNGFGAKLRTRYSCTVEALDDTRWRLVNLETR